MFLTGLIFIFLYYSANLKKKLGSWDIKMFWLNSIDLNINMLTGNGAFNMVERLSFLRIVSSLSPKPNDLVNVFVKKR